MLILFVLIVRNFTQSFIEEFNMKFVSKIFVLGLVMGVAACGSMDKRQRNTAIGAAIGGVAGNMIGNSTGATLGGAALGGVIGSQIK